MAARPARRRGLTSAERSAQAIVGSTLDSGNREGAFLPEASGRLPIFDSETFRQEAARIGRFVVVGVFNTLVGYSIILAALALGAGDYLANVTGYALGLPVAYGLHRAWTFRAPGRASLGEALRYALGVAIAFSANLGVVAIGRSMGFVGNTAVQLLAVCVYAGVFYLISRIIVFGAREPAPGHRNSIGPR